MTWIPAVPEASTSLKKNASLHLGFLDGMRGFAALYVIFHHAYLVLTYTPHGEENRHTRMLLDLMRPLAFGHYAVDLFIVLSGYCLMLPVLRAGGALRGGFQAYIGRRARRILPPYYAALALSLVVIAIARFWDRSFALPSISDLIAHLFLVHNLFDTYAHSINAPMWSVATEWQIYFLFPLLLLPIWKKSGSVLSILVGFAVGIGLYWLAPESMRSASPWYIGLFALGMAGATVNFPANASTAFMLRKIPWGTLCAVLSVSLVLAGIALRGWFLAHPWLIDPIFGLAAMCFLIYCVQTGVSPTSPSQSSLLRILSSRSAVLLGSFSYSLYLIHYPFLGLVSLLFERTHPSMLLQTVSLFGIYVPMTLGFAYLFYLVFERPFMSGPSRRTA